MDFATHKKLLLKNLEVRKALKETAPEYKIARALILARIKKKLSQKELAKKLNTRQSVISRVENAQTTPTISFLKRLASVLNLNLVVNLK